MASASAMPPSRLAGFCCAAAIAGVGDEGGGGGGGDGSGALGEGVEVGPRLAFAADGRVWRGAPILNLQMVAT